MHLLSKSVQIIEYSIIVPGNIISLFAGLILSLQFYFNMKYLKIIVVKNVIDESTCLDLIPLDTMNLLLLQFHISTTLLKHIFDWQHCNS